MAGSYPDVPSRRMAWDADGTLFFNRATGASTVWTERTAGQRTALNSEDYNTAVTDSRGRNALIFPELREFDGVFFNYQANGNTPGGLETSADTTNGIDGTWTTQAAAAGNFAEAGTDLEAYRDHIFSFAASSVRSLAVATMAGSSNPGSLRRWHVYGEITPGQTPDKLLWIDENTGLEFTAPIDFGDVPRGSSEDRELRIRNDSATLTATTIQYTTEALFLNAGAWFTFTLPGGSTFQSVRQIASLGAATTSGIITMRRITAGDTIPNVHAARVYANVDTWA